MEFFKSYIKQNLYLFLIFLLCALFLTLAFVLYGLPLLALLYPFILCGMVVTLFFVADFIKQKHKHEILIRLIKNLPDIPKGLPACTASEKNYLAAVTDMGKINKDITNGFELKYTDMVDYYTVWVHQIKTPISSMRLTLQDEDSPLARKISSDLFRIEQYVEMVLAFLRLDSTATDYVFKKCSLDFIIKQAVKKYAGEFITRHLTLDFKETGKTPVTDEKWLCFVIEQILSNSLKYTQKGGIKIYMKNDDTLCIKDSGIGIDAQDIPRIFEKGYTGYNGRSDKSASGLGLYLCKKICDNLGIAITAESASENGTEILLDMSTLKN